MTVLHAKYKLHNFETISVMLKSPVGSLPRTAAALSETRWPPLAAPVGRLRRLSGGNRRNPAQRRTCMTESTAPRPSDVARLSDKDAGSGTCDNRDARSWLATASHRGTRCPQAFPVHVTGISLRFRVGNTLRCRRASSSLVRSSSFLHRSIIARKASKVRLPRSIPIAAPILTGRFGSRTKNTINKQSPTENAAGFAVKCCKVFHQMALHLTCSLASAQLPRRMQWRS